jgi:hypothetical protein
MRDPVPLLVGQVEQLRPSLLGELCVDVAGCSGESPAEGDWVISTGDTGSGHGWVLGVGLGFGWVGCRVFVLFVGLEGVLITQKYIVSKCGSLFLVVPFIVFNFWNSVLFVFVVLSVYTDL